MSTLNVYMGDGLWSRYLARACVERAHVAAIQNHLIQETEKKMDDFLRERGISEETIQQMKIDKVSRYKAFKNHPVVLNLEKKNNNIIIYGN